MRGRRSLLDLQLGAACSRAISSIPGRKGRMGRRLLHPHSALRYLERQYRGAGDRGAVTHLPDKRPMATDPSQPDAQAWLQIPDLHVTERTCLRIPAYS